MSDYKSIIEKSMTQTDAAIASAKELAAICDKLIDEKENLAAHNAMLRTALTDMRSGWRYIRQTCGDLYGVGWDRCEQSSTIALDATQADVDAWKAAQVLASAVEPVAFRWKDFDGIGGSPRIKYSDAAPQSPSCFEITPLYAAPPAT